MIIKWLRKILIKLLEGAELELEVTPSKQSATIKKVVKFG